MAERAWNHKPCSRQAGGAGQEAQGGKGANEEAASVHNTSATQVAVLGVDFALVRFPGISGGGLRHR